MFIINQDQSIHITRGDVANIVVSATLQDGSLYTFAPNDIIRFRVFNKNGCDTVHIQKDVTVTEESTEVTVRLTKEDTKLGGIINKPFEYWYEIELNPDTEPQTIIGYDENGAKTFKVYPEGSDRV